MQNNVIQAGMIAGLVAWMCSLVYGQNHPPRISNFEVIHDSAAHRIELQFDITDDEQDDVEVSVGLSDNGGETFLAPVYSLAGDTGYPVAPGPGKVISFYYTPDSAGMSNYQIRLVVADRNPVDISSLIALVDSNRLKQELSVIEGIRHYQANPSHLEMVKDYIENQFVNQRLQAYRQPFLHNGYNAHNIIGRLPGLKDERKTYIIDGHFDTVSNSPGADDNGSGIVGMLEAMRILSQYQFKYSLKFIGFDFEESSPTIGLEGSRRYVSQGIKNYERLEGVFNFEMIGYYSEVPNSQQIPAGFDVAFPAEYALVRNDSFRGNFIVNAANDSSANIWAAFSNAASAYVPALRVISVILPYNGIFTPDFRRSDHASFWDANIKAIMLTDGANFRNHNYHTPQDTLGTINFTFMSRVVQATIAAVAELAGIQNSTYQIKKITNEMVWSSVLHEPACSLRIVRSSSTAFTVSADQCGYTGFTEILDVQGKRVAAFQLHQGLNTIRLDKPIAPGLYFIVYKGLVMQKLALYR
ncbi:MAG: hypothetical protein KatS3mg031_1141 [Chitinophagales bacterium]|nr:MAG: hypothetical protein KatS3mg031_1141 [Chitinophagales bacterium]